MQEKNQKEFRVEKIIKRKSDKLYVEWKDDDNYFNSWIAKKYINSLRNLKSKIDKIDVDKLLPVSGDLSKLSDVVKNDIVKKSLNDELVKKVNAIQAGNLVKKADYNTKIAEIEKKILDHDHDKYIISQEFNNSTADNFAARLAQEKLKN